MKKGLLVIGLLFVMAISAFGQMTSYKYHYCWCSKDTVLATVNVTNSQLVVQVTIGDPGRIPLPGAKFGNVGIKWYPGPINNEDLWIPNIRQTFVVDSLFKLSGDGPVPGALLSTSASESNDSTKTIIDWTRFAKPLKVVSLKRQDGRHCTLILELPKEYTALLTSLPGLMTKEGTLNGIEVFMQ